MQVRSRLDDSRPAEASEQIAARDRIPLFQIAANAIEVDVACDDATVLMADAQVATGTPTAPLVPFDALDRAGKGGKDRLTDRGSEVHAAVTELALERPRRRAGGAKTAGLRAGQRAPWTRERMKPAEDAR